MKPSEFIAKLAPIATQDMRQYGVPASLTLAQAILESNWGMSGLTQKQTICLASKEPVRREASPCRQPNTGADTLYDPSPVS